MAAAARFLNPSEAAKRLGVSVKALRLYEQRGLITPIRTATGWRIYGPDEMIRATEIVALRSVGLSLSQVARVLGGDSTCLEPALAGHQTVLEGRLDQLTDTIDKVRRLRTDLANGHTAVIKDLAALLKPASSISVALQLPWPWGGEPFELHNIRPLTYIIGPLGSGKTRLAKRLAETLPDATFLGLERVADGGAAARALLQADPKLSSRVDQVLGFLVEDGANMSEALVSLLVGLETRGSKILVIDLIEQGLDKATQEALMSWLRNRATDGSPLFCLTRSNAVLDLDSVSCNEAIIFCPANHSPPTLVAPYRGAPGYEAVATCLAAPAVRARTEGVIAWRPQLA